MTSPVIRIIDDEAPVRESLVMLMECAGYEAVAYDSAEDFLSRDDLPRPGCVLSDIRMPGMSGLQLQTAMAERHITLPLIFITGHGDIEMAADAVLAGAYDFLVKPVKEERLFAAIHRALSSAEEVTEEVWRERISRLSERERAVLALILENLPTHAVAERLAIGERTVQGHRWRIYQKMGLNSTDLLQQHIRKEWLSTPGL